MVKTVRDSPLLRRNKDKIHVIWQQSLTTMQALVTQEDSVSPRASRVLSTKAVRELLQVWRWVAMGNLFR